MDVQRDELAKLLADGRDASYCVQRLDLTYEQFKEALADPELPSLVARLLPPEQDLRQRFVNETARNIEVLKDLRDHAEDSKVRLRAVTELLDRAGYTPVRRVQELRIQISADRKNLLTQTIKELSP